jgi:hypothetical protein
MGMGEDDRIDLRGAEGEVPVIALLQLLRPLEEAAVHQNLPAGKGQKKAGAAGALGSA